MKQILFFTKHAAPHCLIRKGMWGILLIFLLAPIAPIIPTASAQMPTDNSYVRRNYENSKTAKKAALRKAKRAERKAGKKSAGTSAQTSPKIQSTNAVPTGVAPTASNTDDESNYLEGAILTDGNDKVVFRHVFTGINSQNADMARQVVISVLSQIIAHTEYTGISSFVQTDSPDIIKATLCEPIYFKQKKWVVDSTLIRYNIEAQITDDKMTVNATDINYSYESGPQVVFDYPAEEWITDEYALTANKQKLAKVAGKFRVKTIDYFRNLFSTIEKRLKAVK